MKTVYVIAFECIFLGELKMYDVVVACCVKKVTNSSERKKKPNAIDV